MIVSLHITVNTVTKCWLAVKQLDACICNILVL